MERGIERLELGEKSGRRERQSHGGSTPPQPAEESQKGRGLEEREENSQGVVVPPAEQERHRGVKQRQSERVFRVGEAERGIGEETARDTGGGEEDLALEAPDGDEVV